MKLYTEEQVRSLLNKMDIIYSLEDLTPIELPSDEEIEKELLFGDMIDGAKWMKKQILGKEDKTFKKKSQWTEVDNMTRRLK